MKYTAVFLFAVLVALSAPAKAADDCCESPASKVELKLKEIDLGVLLKQYEEIQSARGKTEVALMMLQTEPASEERDQQMAAVQNRMEVLTRFVAQLRDRITEQGKMLASVTN